MAERLKLGIDFGTSNSSIGTSENGEVHLFDTEAEEKTQPSSIFIRADGYHSTGYPAVRDFLDIDKKTDTYHFIPSVKPGLPLDYYSGNGLRSTERNFDGRFPVRFFPVEELASFVIKDLKDKAEEQSGKKSNSVVLGRPVSFSKDEKLDALAQKRLEEAARLAGFSSIHFVLEPVAAALYYEKTKLGTDPKRVFVFDFGGGTLDTSILELRPNEKIDPEKLKSKVLASHGVQLGGTDLDKRIFEKFFLSYFGKDATFDSKKLSMPRYIYEDLPEWHLSDHLNEMDVMEFLRGVVADPYCSDREAISRLITLVKDQQVFALLQSIEKAKISLSDEIETAVEHSYGNIDINQPLSREQFEQAIRYKRQEAIDCIKECLNLAQMKPSEVDLVLRVGGSSNNAFVETMLREIFDRVESTDVLTSVVAGLSLAANEIF